MKNLYLIVILLIAISCNQPETVKKTQSYKQTYSEETIKKGKAISAQTFKKMSGALKSKMTSGGVQEAINYCSENAYSLVDSISTQNNVSIKRVTLKFRNPDNKPDSLETVALNNYESKKETKPVVFSNSYDDRYFAPIKTKGLCLTCHGVVGDNISEEDYSLIKEKYPTDKAVDYKADELRGIWSITFKK